jgi:hypothetical protein
LLGGGLDPVLRRDHEHRLLLTYHSILTRSGVRNYSFRQCWHDYRVAMLYPLSRIAMAVGSGGIPPVQAREECELVFPRYCRAARDLASLDAGAEILD